MLVITLGDPHGVTVELAHGWLGAARRPARAVIVGGRGQWDDQVARLGLPAPALRAVGSLAEVPAGELAFLDVDPDGSIAGGRPAETLTPRERGLLSRRALEAVAEAPRGAPLAVVTGPIDKHACQEAGFAFPGQTEFFEALWGAPAVMTLAGPKLRVGLVTNHLALRDVPKAVTTELVAQKLALFAETLRVSFGIAAPRLAVAGLNPHASDQGLFGDEEALVLAPAVARARAALAGVTIEGPLPADTVFHRCYAGRYDGVLAMYHDQGLGPLKTVHFDEAVNLSGGLPHLRVSPDHGPARDLFLTRRASSRSFDAALDLAAGYLARRGGDL